MQTDGQTVRLSAGDLTRHLACRHVTQLDRSVIDGRREAPSQPPDPVLEVLQQRGLEHENAYLDHLRAEGAVDEVVTLRDFEGDDASARTLKAMRSGADVIVQAVFQYDGWYGRPDLLVRVDKPSDLGAWSYEIADTKLAQETKGGTVLQLCLYSDLLRRAQGLQPEWMYVVKPGDLFPREQFRFAEYAAYYRLVKSQLEMTLNAPPDATSYPLPVPHCDLCRWWAHCDGTWRTDDHLTLVAGMTVPHAKEFERQGVTSLEQLADTAAPLSERPKYGAAETYARLQAQAVVQIQSRRENRPVYELLDPEPGRGLSRLPEPDDGDVFFDIEGDPLLEDGGREFLFGFVYRDEGGNTRYRSLWGRTRGEEKTSFETFIDFVTGRLERFPGMHVYHYAPYEPTAVKRLMARHATREAQVDRLLRAERFVDLYAVARQGVRAGVEHYSLKDLEPFHGYSREQDLRVASAALRRAAVFLQAGDAEGIPPADQGTIVRYNRDDCLSTLHLRDWLEELRGEWETAGRLLERPELKDGEASDAIQEREGEVAEIFNRLVTGLPDDGDDWSEDHQARWLLAHQLEYFRREDRCVWWEFFRLHDTDSETLFDERKAVTGLAYQRECGGTVRCPVHRYSFPAQETTLGPGDELHEVGGERIGTVEQIDLVASWLDIKKTGAARDVHPVSVFAHQHVRPTPLDTSVLALARWVAENGVDAEGPFRAARDLLLRRRPRLVDPPDGPLRGEGEDLVDAAKRLVAALDCGVLPIQGPPGTGKTFTAAKMIVALAAGGKKVGVTAVSHKVIRNLLAEVVKTSDRHESAIDVVHKPGRDAHSADDGVREVRNNDDALAAVDAGCVVGGTAWLWARDDAAERLDYLFVDEAGQVSLVQALAASRAARNLVLVGDPQQLEQPQQGSHPEGSDIAALQHVIGEGDTIAEDRGLFLDQTWRLHPDICIFTSEIYYEDRLRSRLGLEQQTLAGTAPFEGGSLFFVPVPHKANQNKSIEEAEAVSAIVGKLLAPRASWTNDSGQSARLTPDDILIGAPYNAQVGLLGGALPDCRVGTVDKFQGQQAPVVIYSMSSSSALDAPRGMSFLYSPNRFNVATSRARCAVILVACPEVLEPECHSPPQMKWASGLCRYRELAHMIDVSALRE